MAQKDYSLLISLNGKLDSSVLAAFAQTEKMLKGLNASVKTQNAVMNAMYKQAFSGAQQAAKATDKLGESMRRITEISAGVTIGDVLARGFEKGVDLVKKMGEGMLDMSKKAMDAASSFELMSKGMGAILRDQGFADQLLNQLQLVAYKSPFQLTELGGTARALAGRGMKKGGLFQSTKELGDITAGLGGGEEIMGRLTLAYGEAFSEKTVTKRILNQFSVAGADLTDAIMKGFGLNSEKSADVQRFFKMIHDKQVTFAQLDKAIYGLTHGAGLFTDGMLHFAQTFKGLLTTFQDMWQRAERDLGNIINDWIGDLLRFINESNVWDAMHTWLERIRGWSDAVRHYVETVSGPDIESHLKILGDVWLEFFKKITGGFDPSTMFSSVMVHDPDPKHPGQFLKSSHAGSYLNEQGQAWIIQLTKGIDTVIDRFKEMDTRLIAIAERLAPVLKLIDLLNQWNNILISQIYPAVEKIFVFIHDKLWEWLHMLHIQVPDVITKPGEWLNEWNKELNSSTEAQKAVTSANEALQKSIDSLTNVLFLGTGWSGSGGAGTPGGNFGLHGGYSDVPGTTYYEHPDTEGHSSQYGPQGNRLGYEYGVGLGKSYGEHQGQWAQIDTHSSRGIIWRKVNERSSRDHGIEFVTPHTDESSYGSHAEVLKYQDAPPPQTSIHIHINAIDSDSFAQTVHKHAEVIASHVHRVLQSDMERSFVV